MGLDPTLALPPPRNDYRGPAAATWFLGLYTAVATVRSLIHMFAPDGGARSIAGLDVSAAGGGNLVALFAQWGLEQLLLALLSALVLVRYRVFVPLMIGVALLDQVGRFGLGQLKPVVSSHTPPGAIGTKIMLPVTAAFLLLSLVSRPRDAPREPRT